MIINVLFEHDRHGNPHGCPFIRLLRPLGHPSLQGKLRLIAGPQLSPEKADVVIVERWWLPRLTELDAQRLVKDIRARGSTLIYTLDDNLLDISLDEEGIVIAEDQHRATRYFIREADGVIVSTPALAERLSHLNEQIRVVPNALDERLFLADETSIGCLPADRSATREPVILGYMGTLTHSADLAMLYEPLRSLFSRYGERVRFEIIGVSQDGKKLQTLLGRNVRLLDPGEAVHYEQFARWFSEHARWDIGLAPLTERSFNRYKSDIKFLDYGVLGIPGVYSNVGPYPASVVHEQTGLLVANQPEAWFAALSRLIEDAALRQQIGGAARSYVHAERLLRTRAVDWLSAIDDLHRQTQSRPSQACR
ncbi:MAG: glycosyltransferase [Sterolibacterium sp.]|jgi:glycosyltransferase involved in cell wall biosynthesis|nr:glycosyltransferase [Sterolibacterium sp.]